MAGNVTAFNTVFTYDLYQGHIKKDGTDAHYLAVGRWTTVVGILASMGTAYFVAAFNNIMDVLQLVFAFVNAPLFATFLLGMFWRRTTGHGAFWGLIAGTLAAAVHQGLTIPAGAAVGLTQGGWMTVVHTYPSIMAQNFWTAIFAWTMCMLATILISLATAPNKTDDQLRGLVYSLTEKIREHDTPWYLRPATLGAVVLAGALGLNIIFW
jgi:SSS family solute:Na+ symporter